MNYSDVRSWSPWAGDVLRRILALRSIFYGLMTGRHLANSCWHKSDSDAKNEAHKQNLYGADHSHRFNQMSTADFHAFRGLPLGKSCQDTIPNGESRRVAVSTIKEMRQHDMDTLDPRVRSSKPMSLRTVHGFPVTRRSFTHGDFRRNDLVNEKIRERSIGRRQSRLLF